MSTPRVTVVTGYYNRKQGLEEAVNSILGQTFRDFEYLIFDDCSTDGTRELLEAFDDPRIRLIKHEKNVGFVRGIRSALHHARGEFIAIHGAGDISHPTRLEKQVAHLESHPGCVAVGCQVRNFHVATGRSEPVPLERILGYRQTVFTHGEVMFRTGSYREAGGYRALFYYAQDRDLWYRLQKLGTLDHVEEFLYERRVFPDGIQGGARSGYYQSLFSNLARHSDRCRAATGEDPVERKFALSLLTQEPDTFFESRATGIIRRLFFEERIPDILELLGSTPMRMLPRRYLLLYVFLGWIKRRGLTERFLFRLIRARRWILTRRRRR